MDHRWFSLARRPASSGRSDQGPTQHNTAQAARLAYSSSVSLSETDWIVGAQPSELPTTSLQELKQRVHQLVLYQRTLQQNHQQLITERDTLRGQLELHTADCDALRTERDALAFQLQQIQAQQEALHQQCERAAEERERAAREVLLAALRHVFPYSTYRDQRPDLDSLNDQNLVDHFVAHGIHEGVDLTYSAMENELRQLRSSLEDANAKAELFNHKSSHTAAQLQVLTDLFTKMTVKP